MNSYNTEQELDKQINVLQTNLAAIRAVVSAVEGTLGPKGLDTMLVDATGKVVVTNDGVTILNKMETNHPAGKMLIEVARSQEEKIGDGTTTATILASELLKHSLEHMEGGVPLAKLLKGIKKGIELSIELINKQKRDIDFSDQAALFHIARIAGRENEEIANIIMQAIEYLGKDKFSDDDFRLADVIRTYEGLESELIPGLLLGKKRISQGMPLQIEEAKMLIIQDDFSPEEIDDDALGTEKGFNKYLENREVFKQALDKIRLIGVNFIAVERGVDSLAEDFCIEHGIMVIQRLAYKEMKSLIEVSGAVPIKRSGLEREKDYLHTKLGYAKHIFEDKKLNKIRVLEGEGSPLATILLGASTTEIGEERERIAKDAAAAVQAAIKGGYVPGGGSIELFVAKELKKRQNDTKGLEGFGVDAVASALQKIMKQILINAGFNPLEKMELLEEKRGEQLADSLGIDTDTGQVMDMVGSGIIDPALVKIHAIRTAGEIAEAILRIHTIIRMKRVEE